jgi:hypothetical protein
MTPSRTLDPVLRLWAEAEEQRLRATDLLEHGGAHDALTMAAYLSAAASAFEKAAEIIRERWAVGRGAK